MTPAQLKALQDYQDSVAKYTSTGHKDTSVAGQRTTEDLGPSAMGGVTTDPQYKADEMDALKSLEGQSKEGLTARDKADMAVTESNANRANRGRIGAIQQNMQARGAGGTGMDMVAQMSSSQDANDLEAMKALETAGMAADRRTSGARDLGNMAGNMQAQDFSQQAQKAKAADQIAQFNNTNRNNAGAWNTENAQHVTDANAAGYNAFAHNSLQASQGGAQMGYDAATEDENRRLLEEQAAKKRKAAQNHAIGSTVGMVGGGIAGGMVGGPMGAAAGASAGGQLGGGIADAAGGGYWKGGKIPGKAPVSGESPANDTIPTMVSPGEAVIPRSVVAAHHDAIGHLLDAASKLHKARK
jgi:hypothetical protein